MNPLGNFFLASSLETAGTMMQSCPYFQFAGVESQERHRDVRIDPFALGGERRQVDIVQTPKDDATPGADTRQENRINWRWWFLPEPGSAGIA